MWVPVNLGVTPKRTYKMVPHGPWVRFAGKQYCANCGLFNLNNKFTNWAIDKGCENYLHPSYKQMRRGVVK
tara:strand:+ start:99 stop:311 length:213 start_codon:yes stop_codon:yes gene_type:complete